MSVSVLRSPPDVGALASYFPEITVVVTDAVEAADAVPIPVVVTQSSGEVGVIPIRDSFDVVAVPVEASVPVPVEASIPIPVEAPVPVESPMPIPVDELYPRAVHTVPPVQVNDSYPRAVTVGPPATASDHYPRAASVTPPITASDSPIPVIIGESNGERNWQDDLSSDTDPFQPNDTEPITVTVVNHPVHNAGSRPEEKSDPDPCCSVLYPCLL